MSVTTNHVTMVINTYLITILQIEHMPITNWNQNPPQKQRDKKATPGKTCSDKYPTIIHCVNKKLHSTFCALAIKFKTTNLGQNSVTIDKLGGIVTAPIKRTTLGCLSRLIIATCTPQRDGYLLTSTIIIAGSSTNTQCPSLLLFKDIIQEQREYVQISGKFCIM